MPHIMSSFSACQILQRYNYCSQCQDITWTNDAIKGILQQALESNFTISVKEVHL